MSAHRRQGRNQHRGRHVCSHLDTTLNIAKQTIPSRSSVPSPSHRVPWVHDRTNFRISDLSI
ncbi:hypothetical protein K523DRAFT_131361 [Schizophyllum commune Tattone D]|nr:hypothetical protein K523DRAFT_131361 [Schizophyllum commune Tattone D]